MIILNYLITILFFALLGIFYFLLGTAIVKNDNKLETTKMIVGFIIHTLLLSFVGIIFQAVQIQWKLYLIFTIVWTLCCIVYSIYIIRRKKLKIFNHGINIFIKKYWFFLVLLSIFTITVLCNAGRMWADNLTDDGYYLVRIANLPYMNRTFAYDVTTGFKSSGINSYTLNTWELEASVYLAILHVLPTVFIRFGMSIFNFFLIICGLHSLVGKINSYYQFNVKENKLQYFCFLIIPILYAITMLSKSFISLDVEDTWKNTTAMFYGSSLVRLLLPLILVNFFYSIKQIGIKEIIYTGIISLVFTSRSTVAIPLIFIMILAYIILILVKNKKYILTGAIVIFVAIISFFLKNNEKVAEYSINRISNNFISIFTLIMIGALFLLIFITKEKRYLWIVFALGIMYSFVYFEPINNVYEKICNYSFVTGRVLSSLYFIMYILMMLLITLTIFRKTTRLKKMILLILMISCSFSVIFTQSIYGDVIEVNGGLQGASEIKRSISTLYNNKMLTPDSTVNVGKKLHELELNSNKKLKVITTFDWQSVDGYAHYPALTYRAYAHNIYNYTALFRVGNDNNDDYTWNNHVSICNFAGNPTNKTYAPVKKILDRMKFDCIISSNKNIEDYIFKNYYLYDTVIDNNQVNVYYLFVRK
nr:DUF6077 domain-containing protein [uncultured Faecalibacillus sp.]